MSYQSYHRNPRQIFSSYAPSHSRDYSQRKIKPPTSNKHHIKIHKNCTFTNTSRKNNKIFVHSKPTIKNTQTHTSKKSKVYQKCKSEENKRKNDSSCKHNPETTFNLFNSLNFGNSQLSLNEKESFSKNQSKRLMNGSIQNQFEEKSLQFVFSKAVRTLQKYQCKCQNLRLKNDKTKKKLELAMKQIEKLQKLIFNKKGRYRLSCQ